MKGTLNVFSLCFSLPSQVYRDLFICAIQECFIIIITKIIDWKIHGELISIEREICSERLFSIKDANYTLRKVVFKWVLNIKEKE